MSIMSEWIVLLMGRAAYWSEARGETLVEIPLAELGREEESPSENTVLAYERPGLRLDIPKKRARHL